MEPKKSIDVIPRDVSWMYFNYRILQEAQNTSVPLLERLGFMGIYSNNLDEFFRVRMATLTRIAESDVKQMKSQIEEARHTIKVINKLNNRYNKEFGHVVGQLTKELEKEKILVPSAYYESVGRSHAQKVPANPYCWDQKTVVGILENRQYTGCAVNFKTTTVSYKVHKTVYKPAEEHQIIPDMQEPIISEEQWLRVQELRKHRRRPTATGRTSLFSGLVYCPDCGAKLHFCAAKSLKRNQEFWRCSNYKDGRGACKIHYIRDVVLEKIVFEAISGLADFVKCHETVFLYMLAKKTNAMRQKEHKKLQQTVEQGTRRIAEIDRLIEKVFEQNASGILSDERFSKMLQSYEKEQKALIQEVADSQKALQEAKQKVTDLRLLLRTLRELTDITELTPTLVNALIERIEVHNNDKSSGHCFVKVDIYFTAAGMIDIPTEQEILAMMKEIRENPQDFRFVA